MAINLSGVSAAARAQQQRDKLFTHGIMIAILLLLVVAGAYFGLRVYHSKLQEDIAAQDSRITQGNAKVSSKETARVVDALYRIDDSTAHDTPASVELTILDAITGQMLPTVLLEGYSYAFDAAANRQRVEIEARTDDFTTVAQQMDALKKSGLFNDVSVGDVDRDVEDQKLVFTLVMIKDLPKPVVATPQQP